MTITTTAIGFVLLSLGLATCGFFFLKSFRKTKPESKIGSLLSWIFLGFSIQNGIMGIGALLFPINATLLVAAMLLSNIALAVISLVGIYASYYIFLPNTSPKPLMIVVIALGVLSIFLFAVSPPQPFITPNKGIDFNMSFPLSLNTFLLLFTSIGSTIYIFTKLASRSTSRTIKNFSLLLALLGAAGILNIFLRLIVLHNNSGVIRTSLFDIGLGILGIVFIFTLAVLPWIKRNQ